MSRLENHEPMRSFRHLHCPYGADVSRRAGGLGHSSLSSRSVPTTRHANRTG